MINPQGTHYPPPTGPRCAYVGDEGWSQCKWCGLRLRPVRTMEEREDDPPEDELSVGTRLRPKDRK
jgi:hypothetical protein